MRFFIALKLPETSKKQLSEVQAKLENIIPDIRLTDSDKLHLTIAFIGEKPDEFKQGLIEVITKSARGIPAFTITPAYLDGFPSLHKANILWVGVKGDIDKLFMLRERVKDGLEKLALETDERRFVPHIALGKLKNFELNAMQETEMEKIESAPFAPITIDSIKLFESTPDGDFHTHNTLAEIKLI